jgi:hypothetical protein
MSLPAACLLAGIGSDACTSEQKRESYEYAQRNR